MATAVTFVRNKFMLLTLTIMLGGMVGGCVYLRSLIGVEPIKPKVTMTEVMVSGVSFDAISLLVTLRVDNPNDFELKLSGGTYEALFNDKLIADGSFTEKLAINPKKHSFIKLPLRVSLEGFTDLFDRILRAPEEILLTVRAKTNFTTVLGNIPLSFEQSRSVKKMLQSR